MKNDQNPIYWREQQNKTNKKQKQKTKKQNKTKNKNKATRIPFTDNGFCKVIKVLFVEASKGIVHKMLSTEDSKCKIIKQVEMLCY